MSHPYPHFAEALFAFGADSVQIAKALGISQRSALEYMRGRSLPRVQLIKRYPTLDHALTLDLSPKVKIDGKMEEISAGQ